ncbi:glycosyltransferase family 9 protein [Candidatus Desantisbacteria bacterium]|nr:glycosyltransferase family 9 protein [Candidatus Desantisbacteria bacterium]
MPLTPSPKKILIIQIRRVGDIILTTPVIRAVRSAYPEAHIDFLSNDLSKDVLDGNPYLNEIVVMNEKKTRSYLDQLKFILYVRERTYDMIFDFLGTSRSAFITAFSGADSRIGFKFRGRHWAYNYKIKPDYSHKYVVNYKFDLLNAVGIPGEAAALEEIFIPDISKEKVNRFFYEKGITDKDIIISITPTSRRKTRMWTHEGYARLADILIEKYNAKIIFVYGPGEEEVINKIISMMNKKAEVFPPDTLKELSFLIKKSRFLIGNDNGPTHIAVAMKTPTLTIFGPSEDWKWASPEKAIHRIIKKKNLDCLGCGKHECDNHICMTTLSYKDVETEFNKLRKDTLRIGDE